jgi:hypothetical protein
MGYDYEDEVEPVRNYTTDAAKTFVREVEDEFSVEHYNGYAWREGPGVRVDNDRELVDVIRLTTGRIKWDTLGDGWIVYPDVNDSGE